MPFGRPAAQGTGAGLDRSGGREPASWSQLAPPPQTCRNSRFDKPTNYGISRQADSSRCGVVPNRTQSTETRKGRRQVIGNHDIERPLDPYVSTAWTPVQIFCPRRLRRFMPR